jgi:hypothetical protein
MSSGGIPARPRLLDLSIIATNLSCRLISDCDVTLTKEVNRRVVSKEAQWVLAFIESLPDQETYLGWICAHLVTNLDRELE